jgi:hypothetical protein
MKPSFIINEQEREEILRQHNLFKKVLQSKVTKLMVNEQTQSTGGGVEFLKAARDKKCKIAVGGVIHSAPGKPSVLHKVADYDSDYGYFKKGDEIYIKDDFTFDVVSKDVSGNKILSAKNKKWACSALTKPIEDQIKDNIKKTKLEGNWKERGEITDTEANVNNPKMYQKQVVDGVTLYRNLSDVGINVALTEKGKEVLKYYTDNGALLQSQVNPEKANKYERIKIGSNPDFSEDFYVYLDPEKVTDPSLLANIQANIDKRIPKDKKVCKDVIEDYYDNFTRKRMLLPNELTKMKSDVQACKNEFYGRWGFFGGKKVDKMLDIMSGGIGGPSRAGDDAKWRLN